jgi:hypothetical protein
MTMADNAAVVRAGYAAFATGDLDPLRANMTEDIVWSVPGTHPLSGEKVGIEETLTFFGQLFERSGGTLAVELLDIAVGETVVIGLQRNTGDHNNRKMVAMSTLVFEFRDGKICRSTEYEQDQEQVSAFFA